jgi:dUTP pyrophosphatase
MAAAPGDTEMEALFLKSCYDAQGEKVSQIKEAANEGNATHEMVVAEVQKLLRIEAQYEQTTGLKISGSPLPPPLPAPPADCRPSSQTLPGELAESYERHAAYLAMVRARDAAESGSVPAKMLQEAASLVEEIAGEYKRMTGEDIESLRGAGGAGAAAPLVSVPVTPGARSPALFLDIYPTGSKGLGLPMCVVSKLRAQAEGRDPADSGFDLPTPMHVVIPPHKTVRVRLGIRATVRSAITYLNAATGRWEGLISAARRVPYWLAPRSSISKTPLILANSMGVVDAGYNGELQAALHNTSDEEYEVRQLDRLIQIVSGDLTPFYKVTIRGHTERPEATARGEGGFGSTGK